MPTKNKTVLVALGGNVLIREDEKGTAEEQWRHGEEVCRDLFPLIKQGYNLVITHGNGPQAGNALIRNEMTSSLLPVMPLDICVADTEGEMGYLLQQALLNELRRNDLRRFVVTMITQVIVSKDDPAFDNPTKPIGPFFTRQEADKLACRRGWKMIEDSKRGYRRVVPSPKPTRIIQRDMIRLLAEEGHIVIACGGGGIPIIIGENDDYKGVEAVVDKDRASAILARNINAEIFIILTRVPKVSLNFGKPDQKDLDRLSVADAKRYFAEGHFLPGSMGPKIESCIDFLTDGGERAIITDPQHLEEALEGRHGTTMTK
jgi:carbamate kinase